MTILQSLQWWICWPWFKPKERQKKIYDVGISVAEVILVDGTLVTVTRMGSVTDSYYEWYYTSASAIKDVMAGKWIYADNSTYYNRHYIMSYTVTTKSHQVYEDNTEVPA